MGRWAASNLADDGQPFGDVKNVASCIYGCKVKAASLYRCKHCRSAICGSHSLFVGKRTYCRKGVCFAIGLASKIVWGSLALKMGRKERVVTGPSMIKDIDQLQRIIAKAKSMGDEQ